MPARRVPKIKDRVYHDGHPLHQLGYLQVKLILRGSRFSSSQDLRNFSRFVAQAARKTGVGFDSEGFDKARPRIREVLFLDTPDFLLYRNAFILRRRFEYRGRFPRWRPGDRLQVQASECAAGCRSRRAAALAGDYRVKFKAEALPLKHRLGGFRMLFSHNIQFPLSAVRQVDRRSMATVLEVLPALQALKPCGTGRIELVNNAAVEEILVTIGHLAFRQACRGQGERLAVAHARRPSAARRRIQFSDQAQTIRRASRQSGQALREAFIELQRGTSTWMAPGTTKTGTVYALKAHAPRSHE